MPRPGRWASISRFSRPGSLGNPSVFPQTRRVSSRKSLRRTTRTSQHLKINCRARGGFRRSEERRVGKECRSRWARDHEKKKDGKIEQDDVDVADELTT